MSPGNYTRSRQRAIYRVNVNIGINRNYFVVNKSITHQVLLETIVERVGK